jgi:hypothetical protein
MDGRLEVKGDGAFTDCIEERSVAYDGGPDSREQSTKSGHDFDELQGLLDGDQSSDEHQVIRAVDEAGIGRKSHASGDDRDGTDASISEEGFRSAAPHYNEIELMHDGHCETL